VSTRSFQALIVVTVFNGIVRKTNQHVIVHYKRSRVQFFRSVVERKVHQPLSVSFPSTDCEMSSPLTLCYILFKTSNKDHFLKSSIQEIVHNSPTMPNCEYLGLTFLQVPINYFYHVSDKATGTHTSWNITLKSHPFFTDMTNLILPQHTACDKYKHGHGNMQFGFD